MHDPLPRRPALGLRVEAVPGRGLVVVEIRPGAAADGPLRPGDLLRSFAGVAVHEPRDLAPLLRAVRAGERVRLELVRDGAARAVELTLDHLPHETCPRAHVLYDSLTVDGARLRTIFVRPATRGPCPALLLLPGLACASQDFVVSPAHPLRALVVALAAAGVATLRVERPGLGDSEGGPCEALGWWQEVAVFRAGLAALARMPDLAVGRLGLFGHSIGGMLAPLVAADGPVRRIAVFGTSALPWSQCVRSSARLAAARTGEPVDRLVAGARTGRADRYTAELEAVDLAAAWSALTADVLVVHGGLDHVVARADASALATLLTARPSGRTRWLEIADLDHMTTRQPDLAAAVAAPGSGAASDELAVALATLAHGGL